MSNGIFFYNLSKGIINYNNINPITTITNKNINETPDITLNNISLIDSQKYLINDPSLCIFDFSSNNINTTDISRTPIGTARFFKTSITSFLDGNKIIYKDKSNYNDSIYSNNTYYGELDYVEFSIPDSDINNINNHLINLNNNNAYVEYYFYIWEDINGPWYNNNSLSMIPNKDNLVDSNNNVNNSITNS